MSKAELQNSIIRSVLQTTDDRLLDYLNKLLQNNSKSKTYPVSEWEKNMIEESMTAYETGDVVENDEVFSKNEKWLNE